MSKEPKRIGRPMKKAARGTRVALGLKVTAATKARIDASARATGRTQSQECERRVELSYHYEQVMGELKAAQTRMGEMKQRGFENALRHEGWHSVFDLRWGGHVWLPPGRLEVQATGWVDPNAEHTPPAAPKIIPENVELLETVSRFVTDIAAIYRGGAK